MQKPPMPEGTGIGGKEAAGSVRQEVRAYLRAARTYTAIGPPSFLVMTMVAERGRAVLAGLVSLAGQ